MKISLGESRWEMRGYWPFTPLFGRSMETGAPMGAVTHWLPAMVPGCVIADLLANNVIEDPCYERNSLKCEWVENRWWVYRTAFKPEGGWRGQDVALVFLGVDYRCHIFLNGEKLCEHEGMFEPIRLEVAGKLRFGDLNTLEVVLESAPDEMGQIGYTSGVRTQTSRFGYKWDYGTRLVHSGIWRGVYLEVTPGARIADTHAATSVHDGKGVVDVALRLHLDANECYRIEVGLGRDGKTDTEQCILIQPGEPEREIKFTLVLDDPALWWPNGYGAQPLYGLAVRLLHGAELCDRHECRVGVRSLSYEHIEGREDALPYLVKINGIPIYIKGVNISPLDHMIGAIPAERYERTVRLARQANVNLIRVWGGGVTESELFYDLCDEMGLMVWQEFNQSSSGIDNVPPKGEAFLKLLAANARASVLGRRSHVCLTYWSGGNELTDEHGVPSGYEDANIAMLKAITEELDPQRLFLPTSASGPREFLDVSPEGAGQNHDVHGPWQYQGPEKHYDMYNRSDSLLHSEFGCDGMANPEAMPRFLSQRNLEPSSVKENLVWRHHGEWWDTTERDRELFGQPGDIRTMALCSQFLQAEALRYAVEANRRRAFRNCGSIIWQLNEPWPNLFNTCMVDVFGTPKAVYWWVRRAYAPLAVSLRHDGIVCGRGSEFRAEAWVADDACSFSGEISWRVADLAGRVLHGGSFHADCGGRHSALAGEIRFRVENVPGDLFFVELDTPGMDPSGPNQYLFSCRQAPAFSALLHGYAGADVRISSADGGGHAVRLENRGDVAAVFVRLWGQPGAVRLEDNGFTLFPGQRRVVRASAPVDPGGLEADWLNRP